LHVPQSVEEGAVDDNCNGEREVKEGKVGCEETKIGGCGGLPAVSEKADQGDESSGFGDAPCREKVVICLGERGGEAGYDLVGILGETCG